MCGLIGPISMTACLKITVAMLRFLRGDVAHNYLLALAPQKLRKKITQVGVFLTFFGIIQLQVDYILYFSLSFLDPNSV